MRLLLSRPRPRHLGRVILRRVYDEPHVRPRPHLVLAPRQEGGGPLGGQKPVG